jgi:glycosyltransferase involved in cell wall biosynthesis
MSGQPAAISCYLLTKDSELRLAEVLQSIAGLADEILVVDSGSRDRTLDIAREFDCRILQRPFDNFRDQRLFAEQSCRYDWVLQLDSDEVVSRELADEIRALKARDFDSARSPPPDGFIMPRHWFVLGRKVHAFYPVKSPDYVVRLFRRDRINHADSRIIHEAFVQRERVLVELHGPLLHYTCDSIDQLYSKINLYTRLAAEEMHGRGVPVNAIRLHLYPWLIAIRWFLLMGGWRDGAIGRIHARYVRDTVYLKYLKLRYDCRDGQSTEEQHPTEHRR